MWLLSLKWLISETECLCELPIHFLFCSSSSVSNPKSITYSWRGDGPGSHWVQLRRLSTKELELNSNLPVAKPQKLYPCTERCFF